MEKKPRILFIMHMPPPIHGAAVMGQYLHDSDLIKKSFDCRYINETLSSSIGEVGKQGLYKLKRLYNHVVDIYKTIKEFEPDLVYITPGGASPEPALIRYVFEFIVINYFGCKKLIHFHNSGSKEKSSKWYVRWYYHLLFKNADVIFLSKLLSPQYELYLKPEHIHICPNGITSSLKEEPSVERNNSKLTLLFLSNLLIAKGPIVLLDALRIIINRGHEIRCIFVGAESSEISSASFENEIKERALETVVDYRGKLYGEEKNSCFKEADIFVLPSFNEAFPLVNIEAMEYKLPIISTNVGGIPDEVEDGRNGFICRAKDSVELADCIERLLLNKPLRQKMGEEGYKLFKSKFNISHFEKRMYNIILQILERK